MLSGSVTALLNFFPRCIIEMIKFQIFLEINSVKQAM